MPTVHTDDRVRDLSAVRVAVVVTAGLLPLAVVVAALVGGAHAAIGAGVGVLLVTASFTASAVAVLRAAKVSPALMFQAAMGTYLVKILVLAALLVAFRNTSAFEPKAFGWAVLAATLVWLVAEVRLFSTAKVRYVTPDEG